MDDVMDRLRAGVVADESRKEQTRKDWPKTTELVDPLIAVFGAKVRWCAEDGKERGKHPEFDGIDVDKLIRMYDMTAKRSAKRGRA